MKILFVALNARYVHTNLAIRSLREVLLEQGIANIKVGIREFSINDRLEHIAAEIYLEKPDIIGFSCYIWNIGHNLRLIRNLRRVLPKAYLLAGGPEVSFDAEEILANNPELDAVAVGEGENTIQAFVQAWSAGKLPFEVSGLVWRLRQKPEWEQQDSLSIPIGFQGKVIRQESEWIVTNERPLCLPELNKLPDPYRLQEDFVGKLVYVETSRGCPFNCEFCISSTFRGIRYLDPEKFRGILRNLFRSGAKTIKFVDRTFNVNKQHGFAILDVFREEACRISEENEENHPVGERPRAHCEMAGELLDDEWLSYLQTFPKGMIQIEIGVQSTHQPTLDAVRRPQHFALWKEKVRYLQDRCTIPIHLDLIAGLPLEGWQDFRRSFDEVFDVWPNRLQLGFLKVLKGSGIWKNSTDYGLVYSPDPPYTVLYTNKLSHSEILALERVEEILEKYYNSGRFYHSLRSILQNQESSFEFFHAFAEFWQENGWFRREWNTKALFGHLWEFLSRFQNPGEERIWREVLRFDYYRMERPGSIPDYLHGDRSGKEWDNVREEVRSHPSWLNRIPDSGTMDKRRWSRATAVEYFELDMGLDAGTPSLAEKKGSWYLFYYHHKDTTYYKFTDL